MLLRSQCNERRQFVLFGGNSFHHPRRRLRLEFHPVSRSTKGIITSIVCTGHHKIACRVQRETYLHMNLRVSAPRILSPFGAPFRCQGVAQVTTRIRYLTGVFLPTTSHERQDFPSILANGVCRWGGESNQLHRVLCRSCVTFLLTTLTRCLEFSRRQSGDDDSMEFGRGHRSIDCARKSFGPSRCLRFKCTLFVCALGRRPANVSGEEYAQSPVSAVLLLLAPINPVLLICVHNVQHIALRNDIPWHDLGWILRLHLLSLYEG